MVVMQIRRITALILRSTPSRGQVWIVRVFSEQFGRITLSLIAKTNMVPAPFSLIECSLSSLRGDFGMAKQVEIIDSFASLSDGSSFLPIVRATIERCLPQLAVSQRIWDLVISLLHDFRKFADWKAAALLFVLQFFEQEGVIPYALAEIPQLSESARTQIKELLGSDLSVWKESQIEKELLDAALERIGLCIAKGGT